MCDHIIPSELFIDILSRLPAERLLQLRCVCKSWLGMIDDPYFIKIHRDHQLLKIHDSSSGFGHLLVLTHDNQFCTLSLDDLLNFDFDVDGTCKEIEIAHMKPYPVWDGCPHIASCNGLMLISNYQEGYLWSIWNPLTREVHDLPFDEEVQIRPPSDTTVTIMLSGFGYDCVADDYKVLKLATSYNPNIGGGGIYESYTSLYSLKSDSWKRIEEFPFFISNWAGVFLNGALHCIGRRLHTQDHDHDQLSIFAFNLETEDYRSYKLPFSIDDVSKIDLGEMDGCLSLSRYKYGKCFETWLMNDYGIENSWTMLFSIAKTEELGSTLKVVSYSKSKRLVLLEKDKTEFLLFDLESNITENIRISGSLDVHRSLVFMTSLVRINQGKKDGGKTEERKRKDRGKTEERKTEESKRIKI